MVREDIIDNIEKQELWGCIGVLVQNKSFCSFESSKYEFVTGGIYYEVEKS